MERAGRVIPVRRPRPLANQCTLRIQLAHQALDRARVHLEAFPLIPLPNLEGTADATVLSPDALSPVFEPRIKHRKGRPA